MDDILEFLIGELQAHGASHDDIDEYREHWNNIGSGDPLPCPICFMDNGKISKLIALPEEDDHEPLKCKKCKTIFYKPMD